MILSLRSILTLASLTLLLGACSGGAAAPGGGAGDPPPDEDTTAPFTSPSPGPGLYPEFLTVTLSSNEPATIYYTTDGFTPTVGGTTTRVGVSPLGGILIDHPLSLQYFAIDLSDNREVVQSAAYDFDLSPPTVLVQDPLLGTYGFLETIQMVFTSDEAGSYVVELGGDGVPGAGQFITSGAVSPDTLITAKIPGWRLEIGLQNPGNPIFLHVANSAGGITTVSFLLNSKSASAIPVSGTMLDLELTADGRFGYLLEGGLGEVWKIDTDPASPSFHTTLAQISVGVGATHMALTQDSTRLYVTLAGGLVELDVASDALVPILLPDASTPSGIAIHDAGSFALIATDAGGFWQLDVDPASIDFRKATALVSTEPLMQSAEFFFSPDQNQAVLVWSGAAAFGVKHFVTALGDVDFLGTPTDMISEGTPTLVSDAAIRSDGQRGWVGRADGRLTHLALDFNPPIAGNSSAGLTARGITIAPDDSVLLLSGGPLLGIRIVDPVTLVELAFVPAGGSSGGGTGRQIRFSPDGTRAYLVRDNGSATAEVWVLQI